MRIGAFLAYWPWFTHTEQLELAELADAEGLDSVWVSEGWGQDAVSVLATLAMRTERVGICSGVMQIPARQPAATAMAAATLDVISGGRFRLGLGVSGPQVSEGWYGVAFTRPVSRTREYVEIVRTALSGEKLAYQGKEWSLPHPGGTGLGKPLRLLAARPVQKRIPIYLGAIGPRAVEQVGEIADGWLPFLFNPEQPQVLMDPLRRGLERAGRGAEEVDVAAVVPVAVGEDADAARETLRPWLTFYLGAMGAKEKNFYVDACERYGFGEEARECQERFLSGDRTGAGAALSDDLLEACAIAATTDELPDRLRRYADAGAGSLIAIPCGEDRRFTVEALARAQAAVAA